MGTIVRYITQEDLDKAERLRKIWNREKQERGIRQIDAAKQMGLSQPAVSQYLAGDVALNTDIIMKFCDVLRCKPGDIDPKLGRQLSRVAPAKVYVMGTISRKPSGRSFMEIKRTSKVSNGDYALEVDQDFGRELPEGSFVICSPEKMLKKGDRVALQLRDKFVPVTLHDLEADGTVQFIEIGKKRIESLPGTMVITIHKIVGYEFP